MEKKAKNPKLAFLWLLIIPAQLMINRLLINFAAQMDMRIANPEAGGHPAPAITLLMTVFCFAATIVAIVASVLLTVMRYRVLKARREE